jgi:hypothetical protein
MTDRPHCATCDDLLGDSHCAACEAAVCAPPHDQNTIKSCRRCGGPMRPGIATGQTYTGGALDFPSDREAITLSAGGPGTVIECEKCADCGWSVTSGGKAAERRAREMNAELPADVRAMLRMKGQM